MTLAVVDRAGTSQTGHVRPNNEDALLLRDPLFMVADGVGGGRAGEIASRMCAEAFAELDLIRHRGEKALRAVIATANERIHERARSDREMSGMGTTVTAALVGEGGKVAFANVGDSRAYLLRDGALRRLSQDHSLVGELVRSGQLSEQEAERHPQRNIVTRALGPERDVQIDTFSLAGADGDIVMLCTDGLNSMLREERIAELLALDQPAERIVSELVRAALAEGGEDNVTVVVFRLGETAAADGGPAAGERRLLREDPDRQATGKLSRMRRAALALAALAIGAALVAGAIAGLRWSHFVGGDLSTGHVAVYQGVPVDLFGGVRLYHVVYESPVAYASLDPHARQRLFDHTLRSASDARSIVHRLEVASP